ncbi:hypothetical protein SEA_SHAGRAT_61 [Rhodococcus phage Shagrat]|nr:hypothetical protein SEA_SHAGRAT_61 [Rhodococcus phage Shagrat]
MAKSSRTQICRCGHLRMFHGYPRFKHHCDGIVEVKGWEQGAMSPYGTYCDCKRFRNVKRFTGPREWWQNLGEIWDYVHEKVYFHAYWIPRKVWAKIRRRKP